MKKVKFSQPSCTYMVFHKKTGKIYGESNAVSPEKAINNVWWNKIKHRKLFAVTDVRPEDLDAIEIEY